MKRNLRFGVLTDSTSLKAWEVDCIEQISNLNEIDLALWIQISPDVHPPRRTFSRLLYNLYLKFLFNPNCNVSKTLPPKYREVPMIIYHDPDLPENEAREKITRLTIENDRALYEKACSLDTREAYLDFIQRYPSNHFVSEARTRLAKLQKFGITRCQSAATGKDGVDLKKQPDFFSDTISTVACGTKVEILGTEGSWVLIVTKKGRQGYLYAESVEE